MSENENTEEVEEIYYEDLERPSEVIGACYYAVAICESYDYGMASKADRKMIDEIKDMTLFLTHKSLKEIYEAQQPEE